MKIEKKKIKKVLVAMSGGVDSTVAVALLKNQGHEVVGIFMHFWKEKDSAFENKCCSLEDQEKARKIANTLGIPFYVKDIEEEFRKEVVDYFLSELKKGNTPNPCVRCNKQIKFKKLFETMLAMKFDYIATGHYAQIKKKEKGNEKEKFGLFEAKDNEKDQSYFLYNLTQKQLSKIIFPVGNYKKSEVRKLAKKFGLPVYNKPESQDICFVPEKDPNEFIKRNLKIKKGEIVDLNRKILGEHKGLPLYTIGQRKGLNIGGSGPYFVVQKDMKNNKLIVTNDINDLSLYTNEIKIKDVNWTINAVEKEFQAEVKIRYRHSRVNAIIAKEEGRGRKEELKGSKIWIIKFESPQKAVTPGQSAVIYSKQGEILGGGVIIKS